MAKYPLIQGKILYNHTTVKKKKDTHFIWLKNLLPLLDQVQEELRRVIGSRQVQVEDRKNLPFTDAVIHETQRLANIVPMALPHKTSQDVTLQGFFIKKVRLT